MKRYSLLSSVEAEIALLSGRLARKWKPLCVLIVIMLCINNIYVNAKKCNHLKVKTESLTKNRTMILDSSNLYIDYYSLENITICIDSILGQNIDDFKECKYTGKHILTKKNQFEKCYIALIDSFKFELGVSTTKIITWISTQDKLFKPINNVCIGRTFGEVKSLGYSELLCQPGFGCYIKLPNNYCLGFDYCVTKISIQDTDSIRYIFKRKND